MDDSDPVPMRDLGTGNVNPEGWGVGRHPEGSKHSGGVVFRAPIRFQVPSIWA